MVPHCGFNLHLSDAEWRWASFHISLGPLYVPLGEVSVQILCLFFFLSIKLFLQMSKNVNGHFSKYIPMAGKYMQWRSTSLIIEGIQVKTTMQCHLTPAKLPKVKNRHNECWRGRRETGALMRSWWACKQVRPPGAGEKAERVMIANVYGVSLGIVKLFWN